MDHIIENEGKPVPDLSSVSESARPAPPPSDGMDVDGDDEELAALKAAYGKAGGQGGGEGSSGAAAEGAEAKSIKCSICGKTFKNVDLANFHAEKSGHDQFEESIEEVCQCSRFLVSLRLLHALVLVLHPPPPRSVMDAGSAFVPRKGATVRLAPLCAEDGAKEDDRIRSLETLSMAYNVRGLAMPRNYCLLRPRNHYFAGDILGLTVFLLR